LAIGELSVKDLNVMGTRGHSLKLEKMRWARDIREYFPHTEWWGVGWNALDQQTVVQFTTSVACKGTLDRGKQGWAFRGLIC